MKNFWLTMVFSLVVQLTFASAFDDSLLDKARKCYDNKEYAIAIDYFKQYIKTTTNSDLKNVYIEMANCYFKLKDNKMAVYTVIESITAFGFSGEDFVYNQVIDPELSKYALAVVYEDLEQKEKQYLATIE
jgi:tetratricopeptide (TPR) repeat protein